MATTGQSDVYALYAATPALQPLGSVYGAKIRRYRAVVTYAAQLVGEIQLARKPAGAVFALGVLCTDTSSGSTTMSIGTTASAAKYRAASAFTALNTPTLFGNAAAMAETPHTNGATDAVEDLIATFAAATAPGSGTLVVDFYFSGF